MVIGIGSDHGGYALKNEIIKYLQEKNYEFEDFGTHDCCSVDYPDYGLTVAEAIKNGECDKGIIVCGTGLGISMAANKVPGIRAAVCTDTYMARMSREHNDANILSLGERVVGVGLALEIVQVWLDTEFIGGRHKTRVDKISDIEKKYSK
ncbi:MAG: ribose 5-phosphate isomerase B [Clostridia bacterium]|nr:ribose 5-phosphate isomerase B [Clostridia bacterium]